MVDAPPPRRSPLSAVSANTSAQLSSPEKHGTPVKRVLQARTFSPDVAITLPPTPSPLKARKFNASPSPAKQPSDLASDLARSKLYLRMQQTCKTPDASPNGDTTELPQQPRAHETPPEMPADSPIVTPRPEALQQPSSGRTPAKAAESTPSWDGTPARRLREEATKLRSMSRLNSPALASSRRSLECKNAVGDELARTRSQLAAAEAKVRQLETPPDGCRGSSRRQSGATDLLSFDDASTSTPSASCIGSNIPVSSSRRSEVSRQIQMADTSAPVTVTVRVVNNAIPSARQVTLQPSSSRAGSVLAQLKKSVDEFAGGKVIVRAAAGGWERVSKADQLSEGEQCYLLFDPSEKEQLPSVMLDQAKVTAELSDGPTSAAAADRDGDHRRDLTCELEHLRSTVSTQQAEIESLRAELAASRSALETEVCARKAAETRVFEAFEELAERETEPTPELERMKAVSPTVIHQQDSLAPYGRSRNTNASTEQSQTHQHGKHAHVVDLAIFAEELNEANERASFFQARVAQLEADSAVGGPTAVTGGNRPSNVKAMLSSAAEWVALSNRWSISGGNREGGRMLTPKRRSPTRAAQTPGGATCHYMPV